MPMQGVIRYYVLIVTPHHTWLANQRPTSWQKIAIIANMLRDLHSAVLITQYF